MNKLIWDRDKDPDEMVPHGYVEWNMNPEPGDILDSILEARDHYRQSKPKWYINTFDVECLAELQHISYFEMRHILRKQGWIILPTPHRSTYE